MEVRWSVLLLIMGASLVTFLPRVLPLVVLSRLELPDWAMRWLKHVPIAVMAALVAGELFIDEGQPVLLQHRNEILAGLFTFLVAAKTKSLLGSVVAGIVIVMLLRQLWPV